jgi:hypothetical protein
MRYRREVLILKNYTIGGNFISSEGKFSFEIKGSEVYGEYTMKIDFLEGNFYAYDWTKRYYDSG